MSDEERREIARRFREVTYEYADESIVSTYMDALGIEGCLDFVEMAHRLADLIEPRTCRNLADPDWEFKCSECGFWYDDTEFRYCPGCGAEVVGE